MDIHGVWNVSAIVTEKKGSKLKWKLSIESLRQQEGETLDDAAEFKSLIFTLIW